MGNILLMEEGYGNFEYQKNIYKVTYKLIPMIYASMLSHLQNVLKIYPQLYNMSIKGNTL